MRSKLVYFGGLSFVVGIWWTLFFIEVGKILGGGTSTKVWLYLSVVALFSALTIFIYRKLERK